MRRWEWIQYQKFNNPDTSWTSLTLTTFILGLQLILWLGGNVGTPIWAVSPSCCNNNNTHLMFQDITNTQISQKGPGQKGGGKIAVRTRIATITSPPSPHVSASLFLTLWCQSYNLIHCTAGYNMDPVSNHFSSSARQSFTLALLLSSLLLLINF